MKVEDEYVVVLNEDGLPQMRISPVYRRLLDKSASDNTDETRAYVKDKFRSALWLIKSVEQRQKTIFKVAKSIINFQKDFLDHGIEHLRGFNRRGIGPGLRQWPGRTAAGKFPAYRLTVCSEPDRLRFHVVGFSFLQLGFGGLELLLGDLNACSSTVDVGFARRNLTGGVDGSDRNIHASRDCRRLSIVKICFGALVGHLI